LSIDCKATVAIGDVSRGGLTRGDHRACDHDLGVKEKYIPCGIVDEDRAQLRITFGSSCKTSDFVVCLCMVHSLRKGIPPLLDPMRRNILLVGVRFRALLAPLTVLLHGAKNWQLRITFGSSCKTSDFIVDALEAWWAALDEVEQVAMARLQIKMDNGPESSGRRTQFLQRMVAFCDVIGKPIHLLYYPPYHSKYNPIERCWGILELHWNGTKLVDVETMLEWAKSMTWKGIHPIVTLSRQIYQKGVTLSKRAMQAVEARLERDSELPKWDIRIQPVSTS
jgi:transposase